MKSRPPPSGGDWYYYYYGQTLRPEDYNSLVNWAQLYTGKKFSSKRNSLPPPPFYLLNEVSRDHRSRDRKLRTTSRFGTSFDTRVFEHSPIPFSIWTNRNLL